MSAHHTPGPWCVDPRKQLRVIAANDNTVASTGCTDSLRDQWEANARLIAAAPDLLAFAQWLLERYHSDEGVPEAKEIAREARAAITKATEPPATPANAKDET